MTPDSSGVAGRRRVLAAMVATTGVATAGCTSLWDQTGATDVALYNVSDVSTTVSITITDTDVDEPHTSRSVTVDPCETVDPVNDGKLPTNAGYTVAVDVEGGPRETFEWVDPDLELAPLYVLVDGSDNVDFLLKAG